MDRKIKKDEAMTIAAALILLFTAMIEWNSFSFLMLLAVVLILSAWYFKR
jgi:4-hydroxybenzoate polyprenyltransferase